MELINPRSLIPHEDIDIHLLEELKRNILISKTISPIIVDEDSHVIVDGHHRRIIAIKLGFKKIPVIFIKYLDSRIKVGKWFINTNNNFLLKLFIKSYMSNGDICAVYNNIKFCDKTYFSLYWKIHGIITMLLKLGIKVVKNQSVGLELPELSKEYILDIARRSCVFPPKSTRHTYGFLIPSVMIPINDLY
jgi:hypothetical protein